VAQGEAGRADGGSRQEVQRLFRVGRRLPGDTTKLLVTFQFHTCNLLRVTLTKLLKKRCQAGRLLSVTISFTRAPAPGDTHQAAAEAVPGRAAPAPGQLLSVTHVHLLPARAPAPGQLLSVTHVLRLQVDVSAVSKNLMSFSSTSEVIARAELPLTPLMTSASIAPAALALKHADKGSKPPECGGSVAISAQIRRPWNLEDVSVTATEAVIIVQAEQALGDPPPAKPAGLEAEHHRLLAAADAIALPPGTAAAVAAVSPAPGGAREAEGASAAAAAAGGGAKAKGGQKPEMMSPGELERLYKEGKDLFDKSKVRAGYTEAQVRTNTFCRCLPLLTVA